MWAKIQELWREYMQYRLQQTQTKLAYRIEEVVKARQKAAIAEEHVRSADMRERIAVIKLGEAERMIRLAEELLSRNSVPWAEVRAWRDEYHHYHFVDRRREREGRLFDDPACKPL